MKRTFMCNFYGLPYLGVGKLRLRFTETTIYTIWMIFLTPWFAFGIHIPSWKKNK